MGDCSLLQVNLWRISKRKKVAHFYSEQRKDGVESQLETEPSHWAACLLNLWAEESAHNYTKEVFCICSEAPLLFHTSQSQLLQLFRGKQFWELGCSWSSGKLQRCMHVQEVATSCGGCKEGGSTLQPSQPTLFTLLLFSVMWQIFSPRQHPDISQEKD